MATVTLDTFLAGVATLGTVHTGDGGFEQALGAALLDCGKLKTWSTPATALASCRWLRCAESCILLEYYPL